MCLWQINPLSKFHATSFGRRRWKFTGTDKAIHLSLKIMKVFYLCDIFNVHLPPGKGQGDWLVPIKFMAHNPRRRSKEEKDWGEREDIYHQNKEQISDAFVAPQNRAEGHWAIAEPLGFVGIVMDK